MIGSLDRGADSTVEVRRPAPAAFRHFSLVREDGVGEPVVVATGLAQVGSDALNEVRVVDGTVSRFHCEVGLGPEGAWVKDLGSRNGTLVDGVRVKEAFLKDGCTLTLGNVPLRFALSSDVTAHHLSPRERFGPLVGTSPRMRTCFAQLERAATTSRPVLLEGETGTGKTTAAEALHEASSRKDEPFLTVDCAAQSAADLEATLFGKDAPRRLSVFEEVRSGTLLLDEVEELPEDLQGRLQGVLEKGELRRTGGGAPVHVRCRVVATSRADLRRLVNEGRFRPELFFRLAVVRVVMPPLRQHPEDLAKLVDDWLDLKDVKAAEAAPLQAGGFLARLESSSWPGNVRQLHNHLDRCLVMGEPLPLHDTLPPPGQPRVNPRRTWAEGKRLANEQFEREYLAALLELHRGRVSEAARAAGVDRVYVYRLLKKYGLKG
ncbi:MAG: hypothetical protein AMXMBFR34_10100 [Myxococcaceae bacterium]